MTPHWTLRQATGGDGDALAHIYNYYINNTVITFEVDEVSGEDMATRVAKLRAAGLPWLVAEADGQLLGYAYAGPFRERAAWVHTLETSIYLDAQVRGQGVGTALFSELIARLRDLEPAESIHAPVHTVLGVVALPNDASVALQERLGLRHVGTTEQVGLKFGRWIDVGYWQMELD